MNRVQSAHANYFGNAFDQHTLVAQAQAALGRYHDQYDVLVGTGMSGAMVVSLLAFMLGKRFLIVRKPDDINNHSGRKYEGMLAEGDRLLFVDDFIASGRTIVRTLETLRDHAARWKLKYVGRYEYQGNGMLTWEDSMRWGVDLEPQARDTFKPPQSYEEALDLMDKQMRVPPSYTESFPWKNLERYTTRERKPLPTFDFETFKKQESESIADMLKISNRILGVDWAETEKRVVAAAVTDGNNGKEFFHD